MQQGRWVEDDRFEDCVLAGGGVKLDTGLRPIFRQPSQQTD